MSVKLIDNFSYQGKLPNFSRDTFRTLNDMKNFAETNVDEGHISYNLETKKHYKFNSSNPIDTTLGKWRLLDNDISTTLNTKVTDLTNKINGKANSSHTHTKSQITDMPTKLSQFSNDAGYITAADVDTSTSHIHSNKTVLDGITSSKVTEWNNKSTFDGNYNSLTNKPTIPTVDVNKNYVDTQLANKSDTTHNHDTVYSKLDHSHTGMLTSNSITRIEVVDILPGQQENGVLYIVKGE